MLSNKTDSKPDALTAILSKKLDLIVSPESGELKREKTLDALRNASKGRTKNKNTREAYKNAWYRFFRFCSDLKIELDQVEPHHIDDWQSVHPCSVATQRQHLAAIRLLFDELLVKNLVKTNPAARTKLPRLNRESAHTTVFEKDEIEKFLSSISTESLIGVRDAALFTTLIYSWARISALLALTVEDYYERQGIRWIRLKEKGGRIHEVPVHSQARVAIDRWLTVSGLLSLPSAPLFPAFVHRNKRGSEPRAMTRRHAWKLVQARAAAAGIKKRVSCHSFRATGITEYMNAGGSLDMAQRIAGHAQLSTTRIYDHSKDRATVAEIERVSFGP